MLNAERDLEKSTKGVDHQIGVLLEHIVKDEGAKDGSILALPSTLHWAVFGEPDCGINEAVNQVLKHCCGVYVILWTRGMAWRGSIRCKSWSQRRRTVG